MLEQQFVQFSNSINGLERQPIVPVVLGGDGISFFNPTIIPAIGSSIDSITISLISADGSHTYLSSILSTTQSNHHTLFGNTGLMAKSAMEAAMALHTAFRIKYVIQEVETGSLTPIPTRHYFYSNILQLMPDDGRLACIRYSCNETMAGFPFDGSKWVSAWVPVWMEKPQWEQNEEVYTKLNGEQVVLFNTRTKEYECSTDYMPEDWHEKLLTALMCDKVEINGTRYNKSESYDINWDEALDMPEYDAKLARATFKVKAGSLTRNNNN